MLGVAGHSEWSSSLAAATAPGREGPGTDIMKNIEALPSQGPRGPVTGAHVHSFPDNDPEQSLELLGPHETPSLLPECQKTPFLPTFVLYPGSLSGVL